MADTKPTAATEPATPTADTDEKLPAFPPGVLSRAQEHAPRLLNALGAWLHIENALGRPDASVVDKAKFAARLVEAKRRAGQIVQQVVNG